MHAECHRHVWCNFVRPRFSDACAVLSCSSLCTVNCTRCTMHAHNWLDIQPTVHLPARLSAVLCVRALLQCMPWVHGPACGDQAAIRACFGPSLGVVDRLCEPRWRARVLYLPSTQGGRGGARINAVCDGLLMCIMKRHDSLRAMMHLTAASGQRMLMQQQLWLLLLGGVHLQHPNFWNVAVFCFLAQLFHVVARCIIIMNSPCPGLCALLECLITTTRVWVWCLCTSQCNLCWWFTCTALHYMQSCFCPGPLATSAAVLLCCLWLVNVH